MIEAAVPCHKSQAVFRIPEENFLGSFAPQSEPAAADPAAEVRRALAHPIGSEPLHELAAKAKTCVIICSDHTRPVPSRHIIPAMLAELRRGRPDIDVTLLIATGCHRGTTQEELIGKFGPEIAAREKIVIHDSRDDSTLADAGILPSGGRLILNKLALETDLLIAEGFIEPHFFAGFSGGRKSVLPGIASRETVLANHCAEFIADPRARTGILDGNPIHRDMVYAAEKANLKFIVNTVIDAEKRIVRAFAGDTKAAHAAGVAFCRKQANIEVPEADIVITTNGGYPLDMNVYQSVKGMTAAEAVCRPGGVIIMAAGCADGHGGESFFKALSQTPSPETLLAEALQRPRNATVPDQWQYQILARILKDFKVIMYAPQCSPEMLRAMKLDTASSPDEALAKAFALCGKNAQVAVIPEGVSVIPVKKPRSR
ncbi:MAG: nickel-dependent lactate racemase [Lentisphaeria bacterium]|nr:nickel-dependent lactate racemase [Lentisphaeria bacterium]